MLRSIFEPSLPFLCQRSGANQASGWKSVLFQFGRTESSGTICYSFFFLFFLIFVFFLKEQRIDLRALLFAGTSMGIIITLYRTCVFSPSFLQIPMLHYVAVVTYTHMLCIVLVS